MRVSRAIEFFRMKGAERTLVQGVSSVDTVHLGIDIEKFDEPEGRPDEPWIPLLVMIMFGLQQLIDNKPLVHPGHVGSRDYAVYIRSLIDAHLKHTELFMPIKMGPTGFKHPELEAAFSLLDRIRLPSSVLEGRSEVIDFEVHFKNPLDVFENPISIQMRGDVSSFINDFVKENFLPTAARESLRFV